MTSTPIKRNWRPFEPVRLETGSFVACLANRRRSTPNSGRGDCIILSSPAWHSLTFRSAWSPGCSTQPFVAGMLQTMSLPDDRPGHQSQATNGESNFRVHWNATHWDHHRPGLNGFNPEPHQGQSCAAVPVPTRSPLKPKLRRWQSQDNFLLCFAATLNCRPRLGRRTLCPPNGCHSHFWGLDDSQLHRRVGRLRNAAHSAAAKRSAHSGQL